jgi:hypothetical protein
MENEIVKKPVEHMGQILPETLGIGGLSFSSWKASVAACTLPARRAWSTISRPWEWLGAIVWPDVVMRKGLSFVLYLSS